MDELTAIKEAYTAQVAAWKARMHARSELPRAERSAKEAKPQKPKKMEEDKASRKVTLADRREGDIVLAAVIPRYFWQLKHFKA